MLLIKRTTKGVIFAALFSVLAGCVISQAMEDKREMEKIHREQATEQCGRHLEHFEKQNCPAPSPPPSTGAKYRMLSNELDDLSRDCPQAVHARIDEVRETCVAAYNPKADQGTAATEDDSAATDAE